jgi:hypothetical protein
MTDRTIAARTLVGLEVEHDTFFAYGDDAKQRTHPCPIGPPRVIEGMPFETPYSAQVEMLTRQAPDGANAFVLGPPLPSLGDTDTEYALVVQFCVIPTQDAARAESLPKPEWAITGFVHEDGLLGWIRADL